MCRNIRTLHNYDPPATHEEIRASSLQFVRKLSGVAKPSKTNEAAFTRAVDRVAEAAHELLHSLVTNAPARNREADAQRRGPGRPSGSTLPCEHLFGPSARNPEPEFRGRTVIRSSNSSSSISHHLDRVYRAFASSQ